MARGVGGKTSFGKTLVFEMLHPYWEPIWGVQKQEACTSG